MSSKVIYFSLSFVLTSIVLAEVDVVENVDTLETSHLFYKHQHPIANYTYGNTDTLSKPSDITTDDQDHVERNILKNNNITHRMKRSLESKHYVELTIVIDNREYIKFGRNLNRLWQRCKDIVNTANQMFRPLNIVIVISGVKVWSIKDLVYISTNRSITIHNLVYYRKYMQKGNTDLTLLLSGQRFIDGHGIATKNSICTVYACAVVTDDYDLTFVAGSLAHEIAHTMGVRHDLSGCNCPYKYCLMWRERHSVTKWSSCSKRHLDIANKNGLHYCLRNNPGFN